MSDANRPVPEHLADFDVIRRLGVGGMAEVFLAKKRGAEGTYKLLVVKRILPAYTTSPKFRTMFAEEAQLATRLNHPNIVQVYEFQDYADEGQLLSMEYVEGPDLRKLMRSAKAKHERVPPYICGYIIAEVAKGLHYAHERKDDAGNPMDIVHRDVSPQNILLSFDGAVKIADFGIASASLFREEPGVLKGKTGYMSPEQARAEKVDRRSDVYALGVVLYELLTGRRLHGTLEGDELLEAVRLGQVEPPSTFAREIPPELEVIAMKALSKNPDDRFVNAREMAGALSRVAFQKQQFVDSHVLEQVLERLVSREHTSPGIEAPDLMEPTSHPAANHSSASASVGAERSFTEGSQHRFGNQLRERARREVRHVALVTLRIHGFEQLLEAAGVHHAKYQAEQLRRTIEDIAFKRGARLVWEKQDRGGRQRFTGVAHIVIGLLADPARAPADAAWLAVDVHEAVQGASEDMPVELQASLGVVRAVATGHRDRQGHLVQHVVQDPGQGLADMLAEQAPAGATWVAGGLYRLVRRDFVWGDAPTLQLEGAAERNLPRNLRVHTLLRPLTRDERQRVLAQASSDLVGRDAELADLHAAFHQATSVNELGPRVTARVVFGELGIGKSALVNTFIAEVGDKARILRAECVSARADLPYSGIANWVSQLADVEPGAQLEVARARVATALGAVIIGEAASQLHACLAEVVTGEVVAAADEGDAEQNRQLIAAGLRALLTRAAEASNVILIMDGLQWCDRASLEVINELVQAADFLPVLVILLSRPEERVLPYLGGVVRIELKGLSTQDQVRLLQARLGAQRGVAEVCSELLPRVGGNPFFALEMMEALLERGAVELRDTGDGTQELHRIADGAAAQALPSTLGQLIASRLDELPVEEQQVVEWLAVAGGSLMRPALAELTGADCATAVNRLTERGICDIKGETVDVRHPLTRDVAYSAIEATARTAMHRRLGELLEKSAQASGLGAALVARHFARGDDPRRAAQYYLNAGLAARAGYQLRLASRYLKRALALLPPSDILRIDAHEGLEAVARIQGRWRDRRKHLDAMRRLAKESNDPRRVATALLRTARMELEAGRLARGLNCAQRAEQLAEQTNSPIMQVQSLSLMAEMMRDLGDMQGALSAIDRTLDIAEKGDIPIRLRGEVLRSRGTLLRRVGRVHEAVAAQIEAIAIFRKVGARRMEARGKNSLAYSMYVLGRFEDSIALALESIRLDLAIGGRLQIAKTLGSVGQSYAALGDLDRGLAYLRRARQAHERYGDRDAHADTLLGTAEYLLEYGRVEEAEALVEECSSVVSQSGNAYSQIHERIVRALLSRAAGDPAQAVVFAFDARQAAEAQAYVAYHFYAMAAEAAARAELGEAHTAILLATTALGALETLQGSEYGIATRAMCVSALTRARSPQTSVLARRAQQYLDDIQGSIRTPNLHDAFLRRPLVRLIRNAEGPPLSRSPLSGT